MAIVSWFFPQVMLDRYFDLCDINEESEYHRVHYDDITTSDAPEPQTLTLTTGTRNLFARAGGT